MLAVTVQTGLHYNCSCRRCLWHSERRTAMKSRRLLHRLELIERCCTVVVSPLCSSDPDVNLRVDVFFSSFVSVLAFLFSLSAPLPSCLLATGLATVHSRRDAPSSRLFYLIPHPLTTRIAFPPLCLFRDPLLRIKRSSRGPKGKSQFFVFLSTARFRRCFVLFSLSVSHSSPL
jgi:hypothetical protein